MRIFKIAPLLFLYFSLTPGYAQSEQKAKLDSLYSVWQDESRPDSIRILAFESYIWDGALYTDRDRAIKLCQELIEFSMKRNNWTGLSKANNALGVIKFEQNEFIGAIHFFKKALDICNDQGRKSETSTLLSNIGNGYYMMGDYPRSLDYQMQALEIAEKYGNNYSLAGILNVIGILHLNQGNSDKALEYLNRSLKYAEETGQDASVASALLNIGGIIKDHVKDTSLALDYYSRSLEIGERIGHTSLVSNCYINIGVIHAERSEYSEALEFFNRAFQIGQDQANVVVMNSADINIGVLYKSMGKYSESIKHCLRALAGADSTGDLPNLKASCECLYSSYKELGNAEKTLEYLERIHQINDSLKNQDVKDKLQQMEYQRQIFADSLARVEEKKLIQQSHDEEIRRNKRTRNILVISGIFTLLLASGFYSRWRYVKRTNKVISEEKDRSENLLLNILPAEIAEELKEKGRADARDFDQVTILFTDFKEFTATSEKLSAHDLVDEINTCFEAFDRICTKFRTEKIKTIGDSYMAAGGLPVPYDDSVKNTVLAGLEMADYIVKRKTDREAEGKIPFEMRVGINTGPVVAGIVGVKKFQYDIWGDTVNTASRMESNGEVGKVNISESTYQVIQDDPQFVFEERGKIEVKGKGLVEMYFVALS